METPQNLHLLVLYKYWVPVWRIYQERKLIETDDKRESKLVWINRCSFSKTGCFGKIKEANQLYYYGDEMSFPKALPRS